MEYLLLFLEGMLTFISPCILPMIPVYISYFSGKNAEQENGKYSVIWNVTGFVAGFTLIFTMVGAMAGTFGALIKTHQGIINLVCGAIVTVFGLNYMGILKIGILDRSCRLNYEVKTARFVSSVIFGMVFSIGWTPCVGTFLGSALMIAVYSGDTMKGVLMLLIYSAGLGVPFILCGIFVDSIKKTFEIFKTHYGLINKVSGTVLTVTGISMMTGMFYKMLSVLAI